jgi:hypothetical protein
MPGRLYMHLAIRSRKPLKGGFRGTRLTGRPRERITEVKADQRKRGRYLGGTANGNLMSRFAGLGDQIAASLDVGDAIVDGEVFAPDETGRPQFYDLLRGTRAPAYVAFDLIWLNGADLRALPLTERRQHLQNIRSIHSVSAIVANPPPTPRRFEPPK